MGIFWAVVVVVVLVYLFNKRTPAKSIGTSLPVKRPEYKETLSKDEFEKILTKYKDSIRNANNDDKEIERIANEFELKFHLRESFYEFFSFMQEKLQRGGNNEAVEKWWPHRLLDYKKIKFDGGYDNLGMEFMLDGFEVRLTSKRRNWIDEFGGNDRYEMYAPSYYDYDREIVVKTSAIVYQMRGYDYRAERMPKTPSSIITVVFKPSDWLLKVHNFLIAFENEKGDIEDRIAKLKAENALKRAKERFEV